MDFSSFFCHFVDLCGNFTLFYLCFCRDSSLNCVSLSVIQWQMLVDDWKITLNKVHRDRDINTGPWVLLILVSVSLKQQEGIWIWTFTDGCLARVRWQWASKMAIENTGFSECAVWVCFRLCRWFLTWLFWHILLNCADIVELNMLSRNSVYFKP